MDIMAMPKAQTSINHIPDALIPAIDEVGMMNCNWGWTGGYHLGMSFFWIVLMIFI
jgi:hypothetical protein